ncbi:MAG TPA: DUF2334 domain-containing protein [Candidatus Nanoarchaeia archaeon]|nr:DUF2334 domain-containing protein [Candidatus Nanoarchaeia archaeon]
MKKGVKKISSIFFIMLLIILAVLFLIRLITPSEIDDVSPNIPCSEIAEYKPDILYVIPDYDNHPLSLYPKWCNYVLSLNKTLGMHGVKHTYGEFLYLNVSQSELESGISEFRKCFGYEPETFKPPQLKISHENRELIKQNNLKRMTIFHQLTHKVYHCNNSDIIPNQLIHIF